MSTGLADFLNAESEEEEERLNGAKKGTARKDALDYDPYSSISIPKNKTTNNAQKIDLDADISKYLKATPAKGGGAAAKSTAKREGGSKREGEKNAGGSKRDGGSSRLDGDLGGGGYAVTK